MHESMDRPKYIAETRRIQDETRRRCEDLAQSLRRRPWQIGSTLASLTDAIQACLEQLRALDAPANDRSELELHFLGPIQAEVDELRAAITGIRRDLHRLRIRAAVKRLDEVGSEPDPSHRAWCVEYGLEPLAPSTRSWFSAPAPNP
jgi:hypothetical protein